MSQNVADLRNIVSNDFNIKKLHLNPRLSLQQVDITPKYLDLQKCHHYDRSQAFELFDRARYIRDLPRYPYPSFDRLITEKLRPESYFEKVEREKEEKETKIMFPSNSETEENLTSS